MKTVVLHQDNLMRERAIVCKDMTEFVVEMFNAETKTWELLESFIIETKNLKKIMGVIEDADTN